MAPSIRTLARGFAAVFSSLVLLGPLAFVALVGAPAILLEATGLVVPDPVTLAWTGTSAVAALWLAAEGAAVQLYGLDVVDRGGPQQRAARYCLVGVTTVAALVVAVRFLLLAIPWAVEEGGVFAQLLGIAIVLALLAALYRTASAARRGYVSVRRHGNGESDAPQR
ncbi:hypothetical protein SAMN05216559_0188 [Halomicrobium zhouii]|uniref:DUF2975 domain-containing protein n=1 Tax=Halomicrobium zhouii TaxID=767519 RepID=A0A1I6K533_9EURY|nr:hypothetical protein [Halomicrobium zhouii]SFR86188.1 hypothetical protein SAMN05216559_0188 [Halomicrobium zhouii]